MTWLCHFSGVSCCVWERYASSRRCRAFTRVRSRNCVLQWTQLPLRRAYMRFLLSLVLLGPGLSLGHASALRLSGALSRSSSCVHYAPTGAAASSYYLRALEGSYHCAHFTSVSLFSSVGFCVGVPHAFRINFICFTFMYASFLLPFGIDPFRSLQSRSNLCFVQTEPHPFEAVPTFVSLRESRAATTCWLPLPPIVHRYRPFVRLMPIAAPYSNFVSPLYARCSTGATHHYCL
jgi:hypothetical protein